MKVQKWSIVETKYLFDLVSQYGRKFTFISKNFMQWRKPDQLRSQYIFRKKKQDSNENMFYMIPVYFS